MQDLEIYVRDLQPGMISDWLTTHLESLNLPDTEPGGRPLKGKGQYKGHTVRISLYPGAFGKRYTSVVLEAETLPWDTDLDCARSAWGSVQTEIRCSQGEWQEGDPVEEEKWWRLDDRGEQLVVWN